VNLYQRFVDWFAGTHAGAQIARRAATHVDRVLIRVTKGKVTSGIGTDYAGKIGLLHCTGAKSGQPRTVPLLYTVHGDRILLVASKGGDVGNPAWYFNLKAHPECAFEAKGVRTERTAREAGPEEREALFEVCVANYRGYANYQERVERVIPLMVLEPRA
jgi:deazaflavin-dependent oxidoreductase (nitroreductase family)